ncbi:condensin complex subunit 3-like isoform X2 [Anneissia japonica]|uniref:condensin complex subunit 3-like isoform X2 n=1 Tax=Anneissia japonica TaxID=1529436 RepID=UPI00142584B8|nr:condensin complex subunit 3-like isoform X2 [Anneissia japonica]
MPGQPSKSMKEVFEECQKGVQSHNKLIKALKTTYEKTTDKEAFREEFISFLKHAMIVFKKEPVVERTLEFAAKFAVSFVEEDSQEESEDSQPVDDEDNNFSLFLFRFLLKSHKARDRAVRFRVCQLINKLLVSMQEDAQIDEDLFDDIYQCMLVRLKDKFPAVRIQAVTALARLQDPSDSDCPVINAYMFFLEHDAVHEVRRAVLSCIAPSTRTLPTIIQRILDTKDSVRKLAYQVIAEKVHVKALTIAQRVRILKTGLSDRSEMVRETCASKIITAWLRTFEGNVLELLKCLDVENSCETAEMALKKYMKRIPPEELVENFDLLNGRLVIEESSLTCENVLYWRCLCEHLNSLGGQNIDLLDKLLPTVSYFASYINSYLQEFTVSSLDVTKVEETLKSEFIGEQLLILTNILDLSDEVGRKALRSIVHDLMIAPNIPASLTPLLMKLMVKLLGNQEELIQQIAEIISEIRAPIITTIQKTPDKDECRQKELKLASVRMLLNEARDELETCVEAQEFGKAAELKDKVADLENTKETLTKEKEPQVEEIQTEKNDPQTLVKCLTIASEMLQHLQMRSFNPTLRTLIDTLVLPGILHEHELVRDVVVRCLGLACQMNRDFARQHLLLFLQVYQVDQNEVKVTALKVIFDLLLTYGFETFKISFVGQSESSTESDEDQKGEGDQNNEENSSKTANSLLNILIRILESENSELRTVAAEGFCKLMLSGRVISSKLISRLVLLWYNPTTEEDHHLRHCLGTFLPMFAFVARRNQECLEEAFLPTLETLFNAPTTSPLSKVNDSNVADLLIQLMDQRNLQNFAQENLQESSVHDSLGLKICNHVLSNPDAPGCRVLIKSLNKLYITPTIHTTTFKDMLTLLQQMLEVIDDKVSKKILDKLKASLTAMIVDEIPEPSASNEKAPTEAVEEKTNVIDGNNDNEEMGNVEEDKSKEGTDDTQESNNTPMEVETNGNGDSVGSEERINTKASKTKKKDDENKEPVIVVRRSSRRKKATKQSVKKKPIRCQLYSDSESDTEDFQNLKLPRKVKALSELNLSDSD